MYRALGVGYEVVLRHKKKKKNQMYLFDFIPYLKAHLNFTLLCFN